MALLDDFKVQFPEFATAGDPLLTAHLNAAALEIDADVWGAKATQGQFYLTAHKLALSPFGNGAQLVPTQSKGDGPHGQTTYGSHFDAMARQVGQGVILGC